MKIFIHRIMEYLSPLQKIFLISGTVILIALLFPERKYVEYQFKEGSFWKYENLLAPFNFAILKSEEALEGEYREIRENPALYYRENQEIAKDIQTEYRTNFDKAYSFIAGDNELKKQQLQKKSEEWIESIYKRGIVDESQIDSGIVLGNQQIIVVKEDHSEQHHFNEYYTLEDAKRFIQNKLAAGSAIDSIFIEEQLIPLVKANYILDKERVEDELNIRMSHVSKTAGMISSGELIISKGELITPEKYLVLLSLETENIIKFDSNYSKTNRLIGKLLLIAIAFLGLFLFLKLIRHPIVESTKAIALMLSIILLMVAFTALIYRINDTYLLLAPLCLGPIIIRVFFDTKTALYIHVITVFIIGSLIPSGFEFMYYQMIAGLFAIVSLRSIQRRASFFRASLVIFLVYSLVYIAQTLIDDTHLRNIGYLPFVILLMNAFITMLAYPMIYMIEKLFGLISEVALLELSGTSTPALRDLAAKAPGTFQHSMQVANIAEDLINELGGNANLARVGALYHDIGKMNSAMYFIENQLTDFNPHDELSNDESSSVILGHVADGVQLGHKYKLPEIIIDFIRTHHGTTKTGYFYAKQLREYPDQIIDEEDYTYKGPKPYSRETAVVMLVDSVEAATKSMKSHSEEDINSLIDQVIDGKIRDNQLSNCNITFHDVDKIKQFLKKKMKSIYHVRIEYPVNKN